MKTTKQLKQLVWVCLAAGGLAVGACGDETSSSGVDANNGEDEYVCDPVGANPEMGSLLNAPLDGDVEVIVKTPQHPGDPGPDNLP